METLKLKLRRQVLIPLIAILAILTVVVVFTEQKVEFGNLSAQHLKDLRKVEWLLGAKCDDVAVLYDILTRQLCQDASLQQAFLAGDREALLASAEGRYQAFHHDYGVTHFYFHQPDKTCFLRVHQPARFGDSIGRYTLANAMRLNKPHYGVELGPLGTLTLRYVCPWQVDGRVIGYVELGREVVGFVDAMKEETGFELAVVIDKQFLNRADWQQGLRMLGRNADWGLLTNAVIVDSTLSHVPEKSILHIQKICMTKSNCCETPLFEQGDKKYLAGCFGLMDAGGTQIGRMFVFSDITKSAALINQTAAFFGAMALAAGLLTGIFFYFYIGQIGRRLKEIHTSQKIEIVHRRFAESQLKESKERAEATSKTKSEFMANMSHELRTPMNAIVGFSELLSDELLTTEQLDYVETIHTSSQHLLILINDVLDISKIEAGKLEVKLEACSLKHLLSQVDAMMRKAAEGKGLSFRLETEETLPDEMLTDAKHLYQCLINLVGNAVKFTDRGYVAVRADALKDGDVTHVRFRVQDTGIGIPKDKQSLVFESFRQADSSTSRKYGGTGLGLSISRKLVELMGGTLILNSEEGQGSTFTITLPYECPVEKAAETA